MPNSWSHSFILVLLQLHNQCVRLSFCLYPRNSRKKFATYYLTYHWSLSDFIFCHFPLVLHSTLVRMASLLLLEYTRQASISDFPTCSLPLPGIFFLQIPLWLALPSPSGLSNITFLVKPTHGTSSPVFLLILPYFLYLPHIIHIYDIITLSPVFFTLVSSRRADFCFPIARKQRGTFFHLSLNIVQYQMIFISWNAVIFITWKWQLVSVLFLISISFFILVHQIVILLIITCKYC